MLVKLLSVFFLAVTILSTASATNTFKLDISLCKKIVNDEAINPTTKFTKDTEVIYAAWKTTDGKEGMIMRSVWVADDVGSVAPPNTQIAEKSLLFSSGQVDKRADWWIGALSLSRPTKGWPLGRYHLDVYIDGKKVKTLKFTIE